MEAWNKLRGLNNRSSIPWICAGDFNEISRQDEKLGGALRGHNQMQNFRDVIDECGFIDLGFEGPKFTWSKHFSDGHSIWERLDRGLVNSEFLLKFPASKVSHLRCVSSDHVPIFINLSELEAPTRKMVFRFEEMWLSDSRCGETVEAAWKSGEVGDILKKIEKCSKDLEWWEKNCFGNVRRDLEEKKKLLAKVEVNAMRRGDNSRLRELKAEIHVLMDRETRLWSQRSRVLWLKNGDSNSKFFHNKATQWFRKNTILGINDRGGIWQEQPDLIGDIIVDFFGELFTTCNLALGEDSLSFIPQLVTDEINEQLTSEFMEWEIQEALKQMAPLKAPRPNGMPPLFYQHFWGMINQEVTSTILTC